MAQRDRDLEAPPEATDQRPRDDAAAAPLRTCPNCGLALRERGCKLTCPDPACGFFLSCADYH